MAEMHHIQSINANNDSLLKHSDEQSMQLCFYFMPGRPNDHAHP